MTFYQKHISPLPLIGSRVGGQCRFYPTCSEYTKQAVQKYGCIKGIALGMKRIGRCNPLCKGGYDPLP